MSAACRYSCADCRYRTPRLPRERGARQLADHYCEKHADALPAGRAELVPTDLQAIRGCLLAALALVLFLLLAASCVHHIQSSPRPGAHVQEESWKQPTNTAC